MRGLPVRRPFVARRAGPAGGGAVQLRLLAPQLGRQLVDLPLLAGHQVVQPVEQVVHEGAPDLEIFQALVGVVVHGAVLTAGRAPGALTTGVVGGGRLVHNRHGCQSAGADETRVTAVPARPDEDPRDRSGDRTGDRDSTVVRPATTFLPTQVLAADDADATVIRPTLHRLRDADRTRAADVPLRPLPRRSPALPRGAMLHEYRIERLLGQGGFGITYLATDLHLDAQVAIKEYLPEEIAFRTHDRSVSPHASEHVERYQQGLENFLVEARTLASFRHPNIVRVARFFEAHDTAYMVLEYERGRSLRKWWQSQGAEGERLLLERLHRLLDGLAVVHAAGYLHRDIKPDNIQVRSDDGRFVLLDFGSAGQTVALADQDAVVVTPGYAPLEQYGAGEQGPWSDLYALAATLYWVVAGRKPPDAESRAAGATLVPAVEAGRGHFGPRFLAAIDWALQMDPSARPRSVEEWRPQLLADLGALRSGRPAASASPDAAERPRAERVQRALRRLFVPAVWPLTVKLPVLALGGVLVVAALLAAGWRLSGLHDELPAAATARLATLVLTALGLAALLALWVALRVARGLARPLRRLAAAAEAVRDGDHARALVDIGRRDELGRVARAFNGMVDMLRQRERERRRGGRS